MDRAKASYVIMELFIRMVNSYNAMEKVPDMHGKNMGLYHSERHMLDAIAKYPDLNMSEHAAGLGVTKGAISQVVKKLDGKGFVRRSKRSDNDKAIYLELTKLGKDLTEKRKRVNEDTLSPLIKELGRHSDRDVSFLVDMFKWIDDYLAQSRNRMRSYSK